MAGDWIKWEKGFARKPEVLQISEALNMRRTDVATVLMEFWEWADTNIPEHHIDPVTRDAFVTLGASPTTHVDALTGVKGIGQALLDCHWLRVEDGRLVMIHFGRHNGKTAKTRALTADRMRTRRTTQALRKSDAPSVTPSSLLSASKGGQGGKSRPAEWTFPTPLDTPAFKAAWEAWVKYRREARHSLTPTTITRQLAKLERMGHDQAVASINQSITHGWQGLFEPKETTHGNGTATSNPARVAAPVGKYANIGRTIQTDPHLPAPAAGTAGTGPESRPDRPRPASDDQ